jgi:heptosyltransferase I
MSNEQLPLSQPPQRICIMRLSALGDVTHVIPVVRAIQHQWPETEITWICGAFETQLVEHVPGIHFIRFNKNQGWNAYRSLWSQLKGKQFDVLLHMQVSARSNIASLGIKTDIRLGWDKPRSRDFHQWFINHSVPEANRQHQVLGFLSFARTLGIDVTEPQWNIPVLKESYEFVRRNIDVDRQTLVISPCSSRPIRNWHDNGYARVADYAIERHGMQVVLCGGPSELEKKTAVQIRAKMKHEAVDLVGKDTLQELLALLATADVVISPDSGPMHIANALGTPVLGLHACTWSLRSGPYSSLPYCVDRFEEAAQHFLGKGIDEVPWGTRIEKRGVMELITVDDVVEKLDQILNAQSSTA